MLAVILGVLFFWTWPVWAFVFVYCLVAAISDAVQEKSDGQKRKSRRYTFWAAVSFAVILGGIVSLFVMTA